MRLQCPHLLLFYFLLQEFVDAVELKTAVEGQSERGEAKSRRPGAGSLSLSLNYRFQSIKISQGGNAGWRACIRSVHICQTQ